MEKITPAARRELSFPSPIDVHAEHGDEQNKKETDENPTALQSTETIAAAACSRKHSECQLQSTFRNTEVFLLLSLSKEARRFT
jgi:hypothetical protein